MRTEGICLIAIAIAAGYPALMVGGEMETLLVIEPNRGNPRNSEGDIVELKDGRLCLIYTRFAGGSGDHAAADLAMRTSDDDSRSWSNDKVVVRRPGGLNVMSVSLLRLTSGEIALFYLRKTSKEDCRPLMCISTDEAETWSQPIVCITDKVGYYVLNNDRAVQLRAGRLILPVAWHQGPGQARDTEGIIMCYLSDNNGKTWRRSKDSFKGYAPSGQRITVQEPGVVELKDGSLMMYMRTNTGSQYICHSHDGGETWSKAKSSNLASPLSPASIKRIPWTGNLLCVWNDLSGIHDYPAGRRTPLCLAISKDEGNTWSRSRIIESDPDGWYCYTAVTFVKDRALLAYCAGDKEIGGLNRLKVQALSRDWLTSLPLEQKAAFLAYKKSGDTANSVSILGGLKVVAQNLTPRLMLVPANSDRTITDAESVHSFWTGQIQPLRYWTSRCYPQNSPPASKGCTSSCFAATVVLQSAVRLVTTSWTFMYEDSSTIANFNVPAKSFLHWS